MINTKWIFDVEEFFLIILMTYTRINVMLHIIPLMKKGSLPGIVRTYILIIISIFVFPMHANLEISGYLEGFKMVTKEMFVGMLLGYIMCIPFFIFEGVGFIIENQRGSGSSTMTSAYSGNASSPMSDLFLVISIFFFIYLGGMSEMLNFVYLSYSVWPIDHFLPVNSIEHFQAFVLSTIKTVIYFVGLLAAPFMFSMLLTEISLGLISRFAPQLNVFFLSMSLKSMVVFFALFLFSSGIVTFYINTLEYCYALKTSLFSMIHSYDELL